jgi:hypothetical protein
MTRLAKLLIVIVSLFSILLSSIILSSTNATTATTAETGNHQLAILIPGQESL